MQFVYCKTNNLGTLIQTIFKHIIGRIYLLIRYGRKSKEVVEREYLGSYSSAGGKILLQTFATIWLVLIGVFLLTVIIIAFKELFEKIF